MSAVLFILLGLLAGVLSGLVGIGGGVVLVPTLVFLFGLSQHQAQGTTLAMFALPVGLAAAWSYYRQGHVDVGIMLLIAVGFVIGSFFSAQYAQHISEEALRRIFGIALFVVALKMILS